MVLISGRRLKQIFLFSIQVLLASFILFFPADAETLVSYTDYYNFDGSTITDHNGLSYTPNKDGVIILRKNNIIVDSVYFSITGKINGIGFTYSTTDFNWTWNIYKNTTNNDYILTGYNNKYDINWTQEYHFFGDDRELMKIKYTVLNNLGVALNNIKFLYVSSIPNNDVSLNSVNSLGKSENIHTLDNNMVDSMGPLRIDINPDYFLNYYGNSMAADSYGSSALAAGYLQNNVAAMSFDKGILNQGEKLTINAGIESCQALSESNTTYALNQSILNTVSICFIITGDYSTFDLKGNTIDGVNRQGAAIDSRGINVTIKNGIVQEFTLGIRTLNNNNTINNVTSRNNSIGIDLGGDYNTLVSSIIEKNNMGVRVLESIKNALIISNTLTDNTNGGIVFIYRPSNNTITLNNITGGTYGIFFYPSNNYNAITFNNVSGSTRAILITGANPSDYHSTRNTISNNQISSSGIELESLTSNNAGSANCGGIILDYGINNSVTNVSCNISTAIISEAITNLCNGTMQIIAEDSNKNPLIGLLVVNNASNKTTDDAGVANYRLNATCGKSLQFDVYCSDNITLCGTQTASVDANNDYDGLLFDCSICGDSADMKITADRIKANKNDNEVTVNTTIINIPATDNINITFKVQGNDGLISKEESQLFDINSDDRFKYIMQSITLSGNDFLHVYVDPDNEVIETNEKNNYVLVPLFEKEVDAYLNISTGYENIDNKIKDYLKLFVNEKPQNQADITIAVGLPNKNTIINNKNSLTKKSYNWYFDDIIYYSNKPLGSKPYNGLVGAFSDNSSYIFVAGNDIDGLLAAVKRLISAKDLFFSNLNKDKVSVIEDTDVAGIAVADLLRNPSNFPYYEKRGTIMFANVVNRILNNNNFEVSIKTVRTVNDNTTLRLKNINTDFSDDFKDSVIGNSKPVVLARGLWSNLFSWEDFGQELAFDENNARDTWLIEITGGPKQDCDTCPNYEYEDLVDYYWPALIAGVQNYSGQKTLDYVAHSNGCRVSLDSLKNWTGGKINSSYIFDSTTGVYVPSNLGSNAVNTFIGVGCPGAFEGTSLFITCFGQYGQAILNYFQDHNITHPTQRQVGQRLAQLAGDVGCGVILPAALDSNDRISRNLGQYYLNSIQTAQDPQPGSEVNLAKFFIIYGNQGYRLDNTNDYVVTQNDATVIFNNINSANKNITGFFLRHNELPNDANVQNTIRRNLR